MVLPSGEKRGCPSKPVPLVMRVAFPPAIGSVYRSPVRSKTIVFPSGETSSDSHVPSSVVKAVLRVGMIGSSVFGAVFFDVCSRRRQSSLRLLVSPYTCSARITRWDVLAAC